MFLLSNQARKRQDPSQIQEAKRETLDKTLSAVDRAHLQNAVVILLWSQLNDGYISILKFIKYFAKHLLALLVRLRNYILLLATAIPLDTKRESESLARLLEFYRHNTNSVALDVSGTCNSTKGLGDQDNGTLLQSRSTRIKEFQRTFYCYQIQDEHIMDLYRRQLSSVSNEGSSVGNNSSCNDNELESSASCCWPANYPSTLPGQQNINMVPRDTPQPHRQSDRCTSSHEAQGRPSNLACGPITSGFGLPSGGSSALAMQNTRSIVYTKPPTNDTSREISPQGDLRKHDCSSARRPLISGGLLDAHHLQRYRQDCELQACCSSKQQWQDTLASQSETMHGRANTRPPNRQHNGDPAEVGPSSLMLVSKAELCDLTASIALSLNKMQHLEEQVRVIPELQRRLEHVIADSSARSDYGQPDSSLFARGQMNEKSRNESKRHIHAYHLSETNYFDQVKDQRVAHRKVTQSFEEAPDVSNDNRFKCGRDLALTSTPHNHQSRGCDSSRGDQHPIGLSSLERRASQPDASSKLDYDDLLNDLLSLSYSVNCPSHESNHSIESISSGRLQVKDSQQQSIKNNSSLQLPDDRVQNVNKQSRASGSHGSSAEQQSRKNMFNSNYPLQQNSQCDIDNHRGSESCNQSSSVPNRDKEAENRAGVNYMIIRGNNDPSNQRLLLSNSMTAAECKRRAHNVSREGVITTNKDEHDRSSSAKSPHARDNIPTSSPLKRSDSRKCNQYTSANTQNQPPFQSTPRTSMITTPSSPTSPPSISHNEYQPTSLNHNMNHQTNATSAHGRSYLSRNLSNSGSLSLHTTPVKSPLDCGCSSFRDHLRYNSISREQRLGHARSLSVSTTNTSQQSVISVQSKSNKVDASTNTDLFMDDVVSKLELGSLISSLKGSQTSDQNSRSEDRSTLHLISSPMSESFINMTSQSISSSGSLTSSEVDKAQHKFKLITLNSNSQSLRPENENEKEDDDDNDDDPNSDGCSIGDEEPCSLGSSYQDPSDFEEYCAYGETLERRTKDFMSKSTNIPNDLRFALVSLNNCVRRGHPLEDLKSHECISVIRKEWFDVTAMKDSTAERVKLYVDYLESFTKQILNTIINLTDNAGNTVIHYAASHYKFDIIKVLLETKVCDVNCRNKAGYTPIMLLALVDITKEDEQDIAKRLFTIGDVNIKARSSGQTALMLAARHGRLSTCKLLLECGADPSLQDLDGSTALMCASEFGNVDVVKCLLASKMTDPTTTDNDGMDALTIAMNNGHKNIGLLLYAAKNIPRMATVKTVGTPKTKFSNPSYLGASMRRSRGKLASSFVKRSDSLLGSRSNVTR